LGQPLRAEIELSSPNKEEISSLVPKVASLEAFRQASIEFNPALLSLRFAIEPKGNGYVIRVSSTQPMNEPWIDFLLEMNAGNGRLVREYTFLLDPSEGPATQSAQVSNAQTPANPVRNNASAPAATIEKTPLSNDVPVTKKSPAKKNEPKVVAARNEPAKGAHEYRVKAGDTLMKIASTNLDGVSLDQMLVGIFRANPDAFVGENMNRLKAGQILTIPDADTVRSTAGTGAHAVVQAHSADFNAYRNHLAGQVMAAPAEKKSGNKQTASGSITTKVKEAPSPTNDALDKLKLSKIQQASTPKKGDAKSFSEEDRIAKDKALADANARVKELEKNVGDLNKLLAVPAKSLASQSASASKPASAETTVKANAPVASAASAAASASMSASASASASSKASASSLAVASSSASSATTAAASASSGTSKPKKTPPPPPPPVVEESSWFDTKYLAAGGLLAALAGAIGLYLNRKKKNVHQFEDSILTGSSLKANSMFGSTGGQSVDTNNSVFNSNFAPSASQLDANEVDPVAEADVYIAYGRDSQAEEILKEALKTQPDRHAVRLKLLEIYYGRKDARSFELFAGELYGMTRGEGEDWEQAASMGVALDPTNPLYAGASAHADTSIPSGLGMPTQPLEDLDPDALLENSLSQDMLESISIIDTAAALSEDSQDKKAGDASGALDLGGLDFDLDISDSSDLLAPAEELVPTLPELSISSTTSRAAIEEEPAPAIDFGSIDFDLGSDEADAKAPAIVKQSEPQASGLSLANDDSELSLNIEPLEIGTTGLNMSMQDEEPVAAATQSDAHQHEPSFDLAGIDLDLNASGSDEEVIATDVNDVSPYNAEMATKLDLAVAYQEIGDKEGARELLDEVIKGGSADQVEKAKHMLENLG
jgi:pilus assembly protein FimV